MKRRADLSRLVSLDWTPTEAAIILGLLEGVRQSRGNAFGDPVLSLIDDTTARIRLQLKQLHWPQGHNQAPFPV